MSTKSLPVIGLKNWCLFLCMVLMKTKCIAEETVLSQSFMPDKGLINMQEVCKGKQKLN
jgi:hypothetical protein